MLLVFSDVKKGNERGTPAGTEMDPAAAGFPEWGASLPQQG